MSRPWETDNCEALSSYFAYYTVPQAALLWCGVAPGDVAEHITIAEPISQTSERGKAILRHPYIKCLEPRCRAIQDAIDNGILPVGREGSRPALVSDVGHVAYSRRTLSRGDLKAWIAAEFPSDKPSFLFDEVERATHSAYNAESFRALQADRDALRARLDKATDEFRRLRTGFNEMQHERDSLRAMVDKIAVPGDRAEATYLTIIGAMLELLRNPRPGREESDAVVIRELVENYSDKPGISKSTLEGKFAEARRRLNST